MKIIVIVIIISLFFGGCGYINRKIGLSDDNLIEEAIEYEIKENTGLDIDLTPNTPEK